MKSGKKSTPEGDAARQHSATKRFTERGFIARIRSMCAGGDNDLFAGIGDDCAVIKNTGIHSDWLVTTDSLVDGVHFDRDWHPPRLLGRKAAAVNISDIAAMGGQPRFALLAIAISPEIRGQWLDDFISGFLEQLSAHKTVLIGGDTVGSPFGAVFTITLIGQGEPEKIMLRSGARAGDSVWVSGPLGGASAGLSLCRAGHLDKKEIWPELFKAHLDPDPKVALGMILGQSGLVHAMQDISDGLATDLGHICSESGVGAEIEEELLPCPENLEAAAHLLAHDMVDWQVRGGEDYQLLFTAAAAHDKLLVDLVQKKAGHSIFRIGRIVTGNGVSLLSTRKNAARIDFQGFDHFSHE